LKSDNDEDSTKGFIYVETGEINVTSGLDAISAETDVLIANGSINITSAEEAVKLSAEQFLPRD